MTNLLVISPALAHPGRTDAYGCHTCRTNCSKWGLSQGEYHCHNAKALPQPKEPIRSHYSETGGYTTSAQEYKNNPIIPPVETSKAVTKNLEKLKIIEKEESWIKKLLIYLFK